MRDVRAGKNISIHLGNRIYEPPPTPIRAAPPAPPEYFVGREDELRTLAQALLHGDRPQAITALQGMGGIGKTALARKLAADLAADLPGGVFWADLAAQEGDPLPILAAWGRLCGRDLSRLTTPQERADALRGLLARRLAEKGRALVILDDVRPAWLDGARTLRRALPPGLPLLLTTREAPVAQSLRAHITRLDLLSEAEACALLSERSGGALRGAEAEQVARLCGYLPLALELAAAVAAYEGAAWLLGRLEEERTRLAALALDGAARKDESVRLTFALSYRALAARYPETARVFRCLGAFAPAPVDPARLAGVLAEMDRLDPRLSAHPRLPTEEAEDHLRRLRRWALVRGERERERGEREGRGERYGLHPLLGDYARELLAEEGEEEAAYAAHTAHYLAYAEAHQRAAAADYDALEAEREQILAALDRAYAAERWAQVRRFVWALCQPADGYLSVRGYWAELGKRLKQAIRAAEAEGEEREAAAFSGNLATLLHRTGDLTAARREYRRVLAIFEELGERKSMAALYHQLGMLAQDTGEYGTAQRLYEQGLEIREELGDRAGVAKSLHQLGALAQATGEYGEARRLYEQSLEIKEELGDRAGVARSLHGLGNLAYLTGEYGEARRLYKQSLEIEEELGDRAGVATSLHQLGMLAQDRGEYGEARRLYAQSLEIKEELGDRAGVAASLGQLANLAQAEGDQAEAERLYRQVLAICRDLGDIVTEGVIRFNLALLYEDQGRPEEALPLLERVVEIDEQVGLPDLEQDRRVLERVRAALK